MTDQTNLDTLIVNAALAVAGEVGWKRLSFADIATKANLSELTVRRRYPAKALLLNEFMSHIDNLVLAQDVPFDDSDSQRDRIFEILMLRFEAMQPYKESLRQIAADLRKNPISTIANGPNAALSMAKMLAAANLTADGLLGIAHAHGLLAAWLATGHVWLLDDSPDMTRTMAALDKNLRRGEKILNMLPRLSLPSTAQMPP